MGLEIQGPGNGKGTVGAGRRPRRNSGLVAANQLGLAIRPDRL